MTPRVDTLVLKEASIIPIGTCLSVGIDPSSSFRHEEIKNIIIERKSSLLFIKFVIFFTLALIIFSKYVLYRLTQRIHKPPRRSYEYIPQRLRLKAKYTPGSVDQ